MSIRSYLLKQLSLLEGGAIGAGFRNHPLRTFYLHSIEWFPAGQIDATTIEVMEGKV
jgi:hypothetical protein